ncbi:MAG TPA: hypothetical protein VF188_16185 [Longimicrobiales bacterium]
MTRLVVVLPLLALTLTSACSSDRSGVAHPAARDSAGITILAYAEPDSASDERVQGVAGAPLFSIGGDSLPLYDVIGPYLQESGGIVLGSAGLQSVLFFDSAGNLRRRVGGRGDGPGEYSGLTRLSVGPGDSVLAYDSRQRRATVYSGSGELVRTVSIAHPAGAMGLAYLAALTDGRMIAAFQQRVPATAGLSRDSVSLWILAPDGQGERALATFPGLFVHWGPHRLPGFPEAATIPVPVPLSGLTAVAGHGDSTYVATADRFTLTLLTPDGVRRITRRPVVTPRITDHHRELLFAALGDHAGMNGPEGELMKSLRGPENLPVFGTGPLAARIGQSPMIVTDEGGVWLQPFAIGDSIDSAWQVYDSEGYYAGRIELPARFRPTAVRGDLVVGVYRDSLDVEFVRAYRLEATR